MTEQKTRIDPDILKKLPPLSSGKHDRHTGQMCVMEAVAYVAGERWSDHPECACPVIGTFLRSFNDALDDNERQDFLTPLIPQLVNTRADDAVERRRIMMAADWLIRVNLKTWLRLAGLINHADALEKLAEITDLGQFKNSMILIYMAENIILTVDNDRYYIPEKAFRIHHKTGGHAAYSTLLSAKIPIIISESFVAAALNSAETTVPAQKFLQSSALDLVHRMIKLTEILGSK